MTTISLVSGVARDATHRFSKVPCDHGHEVAPADLGGNILTVGIDLLVLPRDTRLRIGARGG